MSKEAKSSTDLEFGRLVRYNWTQNQESLKNLRIYKKNVKNDGISTGFLKFLGLGPNFNAPNYQIQNQCMILLL